VCVCVFFWCAKFRVWDLGSIIDLMGGPDQERDSPSAPAPSGRVWDRGRTVEALRLCCGLKLSEFGNRVWALGSRV
jgi:hypothetical protein